MSVNTDELNYLVWRYLQETGFEVTAFSFLKESETIEKFDNKFGSSIPIGSLVNLVQKGILYSEVDNIVQYNGEIHEDKYYGENFNLFRALNIDSSINAPIQPNGRFKLENDENGDGDATSETTAAVDIDGDADVKLDDDLEEKNEDDEQRNKKEESVELIKVLGKVFTLDASITSSWNPTSSSVLAYGLNKSRAKIGVYIKGQESKEIVLNHGSTTTEDAEVNTVSWSPLGHLLATSLENGEIRLWTADGKLRNVLYLHHSPIIYAKWSPQSDYLLTTDSENSTILWDTRSGNVVQHFDLSRADTTNTSISTNVTNASFPSSTPSIPNQSSTSDITTLNTPSSTTPITSIPSIPQQIETLGVDASWIDDNKFVVPGLNGSVLVFKVGDRSPDGTLIGHTKPISVINFNQSNSLLLTASDDRTIRIWNGLNFNNSQVLRGHSQPIVFADWLSDDFIISGSLDSSIRLWDIRNGVERYITIMDGVPILYGEVSPNKKQLAIATTEGTISIIDIDLLIDKKFKVVKEYQPNLPNVDKNDDDFFTITSLHWNNDSNYIIGTYSYGESCLIQVN